MQDGVRSPSPGRYEPLLVHPDAGAALSELLRRSAADLLLVSPRAVSGSQPASPPTSAPASAAVASAAAAAPTPPKPPPPVAADATARRAERRDRPSNPRRCGSLRHDLLRQSEALALSIDSHSNAIASMEATLAMRSAEASELARQVKEGRRAVAVISPVWFVRPARGCGRRWQSTSGPAQRDAVPQRRRSLWPPPKCSG
eukprot:TRINITY_DN20817_c0_g1_i1.p3 TRINITY_DN20817_c0_g1~~TRINITY_DN20817_c0_g1_i1.p3  ORF type:complete len:220 (+),score=54.05 TRINITY_DN20817_c0_g1_i1:59-661(+)